MVARLLNGARRHPLVTFFVLAYTFAWGTFALLDGPFLFPYGPFLAALVVASVTHGKAGLKDLLSRCVRWRVGLRWYAAALGVPVALALAAVSLNILLGAPLPTAAQLGPWYSLFLLFPMALVDAPLFEETGWRGYALPRFSANRSRLANTLLLGVLLAGWHLPIALQGGILAVPYVIAGIAAAVLINWVYYNTRESAFLAIVYHTAQNSVGGWYLFRMFSGPDQARLWWLWAAVLCVAATGLVVFDRSTWLARRPAAPAPPHGEAVPARP